MPGGGGGGVSGGRKLSGGVKTLSGGPGVNGAGVSGSTRGGSRLVSSSAAGADTTQGAGDIAGAVASSIGRQAHSWGCATGPT